MTSVKFLSGPKGLCGFEMKGHSSVNCDDAEGKLVCSAVSSAAYMAANTVTEIIKDKHKVEERDGFMLLEVPEPSEASVLVLKGLKLHLTELSKQYSKRIRIITEV